jgi:hypothetical protein
MAAPERDLWKTSLPEIGLEAKPGSFSGRTPKTIAMEWETWRKDAAVLAPLRNFALPPPPTRSSQVDENKEWRVYGKVKSVKGKELPERI